MGLFRTMQLFFAWVVLLLLMVLPPPVIAARTSASLIAFDQLVQPHHTIQLKVRLVTTGLSLIRRPISGERIEFILKGRSLGQTLTGGDGLAVRHFTPTKPGLYVVTARLVQSPRYEAEPAELIVACQIVSYPIFLVHLSSTKTPGKPPPIPFISTPTASAMPEAATVLSKLSRRYQILYLESGHEALLPAARTDLMDQGFPRAPLFVWRPPGETVSRTDWFTERLQEMKDEGWVNLSAGISRSVLDAEGLTRMKIEAIVMADEDDDLELPKGAKKVTNWKAVASVLKNH